MTRTDLVNRENKIKKNFLNKIELVETTDIENNTILIEKETLENYIKLEEFLLDMGIEIGIDNAYRDVEEQQRIWDEFEELYGKEYRDTHVAEPGTSEHHTGLAIDFYLKRNGLYPKNDQISDEDVPYYEDIHGYLHKFGFILRYPKGKESITGYAYEPWHIRYVGKTVAKIIYENNYTLEEYLKEFRGFVIVNKDEDMTSFDVVNKISKMFGIKRVGHTGTLDPLAKGVLIVAIGKYVRAVELITAKSKEYIAGVRLGIRTDTRDITGKVVEEVTDFNVEDILEDVVNSYKKTYMQEVPIYSAVKVDGKKLYEYARKGIEVELPKKEVTIEDISVEFKSKKDFILKTTVSKGTYIRSLIDDIGEDLKTHATMTSLTRTKQGNIMIEEASTLEEILEGNYKIYDLDKFLDYPMIKLSGDLLFKVSNGVTIENTYGIEDKVIFIDENAKIIAIYEAVEEGLKSFRNF